MNIHKDLNRIKSVAMFQAIEHNCNYFIIIHNHVNYEFDEEKSTYEVVGKSYFEKERTNVVAITCTDAMWDNMTKHFDEGWIKLFNDKKAEMESVRAFAPDNTMPIVNYDRGPESNITPVTSPVVKEKEPERNDPCPCGSGKKYKKCCLK